MNTELSTPMTTMLLNKEASTATPESSIPVSIDTDYAAAESKSWRRRLSSASLAGSCAAAILTVALPVVAAITCSALATAAATTAIHPLSLFEAWGLTLLNAAFIIFPAIGVGLAVLHPIFNRKLTLNTVAVGTFNLLVLATQVALFVQGR